MLGSRNAVRCGGDGGLGSHKDLTYFRANVGPGEFWFGHYMVPLATDSINGTLPCTRSVFAVAPPVGFEQVWNDHGSRKSPSYSCWRLLPPQGYVALGYILKFGANNYDPPSGSEIQGLACVKA